MAAEQGGHQKGAEVCEEIAVGEVEKSEEELGYEDD